MIQLVGAVESCLLASDYDVRRSPTSHFAPSAPNCSDCLIAIGIDINAVLAGALDIECQVRSIDLECVSIIQMPHAKFERALRKLNLCRMVIKIQESNAGFRIHPDRC